MEKLDKILWTAAVTLALSHLALVSSGLITADLRFEVATAIIVGAFIAQTVIFSLGYGLYRLAPGRARTAFPALAVWISGAFLVSGIAPYIPGA